MKNYFNKTTFLAVALLIALSSVQLFAVFDQENKMTSLADNDVVKIAKTMTEDEFNSFKDNDVLSLPINTILSIQLSFLPARGIDLVFTSPTFEDKSILTTTTNTSFSDRTFRIICTPLSIGTTKMTVTYPNGTQKQLLVEVTEAPFMDIE